MIAYAPPDLHPREVRMFGDVVRERRLARGWTQQQLAERIGVTTPYISMIEGKKRGQEPGHDVLVGLAREFDTTIEELRAAAIGDAEFPLEDLLARGLEPEIARTLAAQWERLPVHRRHGLITRAKRLATLQAEITAIKARIIREEGQPRG